jgi:hypothetical protein
MAENEVGASGAVFGRVGGPRIPFPDRGVVIGLRWSGAEGAGNQIVAAKVELQPERARLVRLWRPFGDSPGRRDIKHGFAKWLAEETRWAEQTLTVGLDFAFSLAETHLRQLGLLRQSLQGPAALGRLLEERFLGERGDFSEAAARFRNELGKDRPRLTDGYRGELHPPTHARTYRATFFGLCTLAGVEASFPPWDPPQAGRPTVVEVRPAHVARVLAGVASHRDDTKDGTSRAGLRAGLLRTLRAACRLEFEMEQAAQAVEDARGEYFDAILAAVGAAGAWGDGFVGVPANVPRCEGWIHSIREEPWRGAP